MCAGGGKLGQSQPSPYADNYGYSSATESSTVSDKERQWYIDNGFGDPNRVTQLPIGGGGLLALASKAPAGYYQGVSPGARKAYVKSFTPEIASRLRGSTSVTLATPPATTRWAGKSLTINPVSM